MTKTKASPFDETPDPRIIVPFYSKRDEISEAEWLRVRLVGLTIPRDSEPRSITRERARIEVAKRTLAHFRALNLSPIFSAYDYEALKLLGER